MKSHKIIAIIQRFIIINAVRDIYKYEFLPLLKIFCTRFLDLLTQLRHLGPSAKHDYLLKKMASGRSETRVLITRSFANNVMLTHIIHTLNRFPFIDSYIDIRIQSCLIMT